MDALPVKPVSTKLLVLAICALMLPSCASIFSGNRTDVRFESTPPGARVMLDGANIGTTPCIVTLRNDGPRQITMTHPEHGSQTTEIERSVSGLIVGNILLGGIPGFIIDGASGAWHTLDERVFVSLDGAEDPEEVRRREHGYTGSSLYSLDGYRADRAR